MRVGVLMHFDLLNPNLETEMIYLSYFFFGEFIKKLSFLPFFSGFANQTLSQLLIELESSSKKNKRIPIANLYGAETLSKPLAIIVFL